jgi:hypothetical protein
MIERHATCLRKAKFSQDVSDHDIVYIVLLNSSSLYGSFHDLLKLSSWSAHACTETHRYQNVFWVSIFVTTLKTTIDWRPDSGKQDNIIWALL